LFDENLTSLGLKTYRRALAQQLLRDDPKPVLG
jgi:hypothetical protein